MTSPERDPAAMPLAGTNGLLAALPTVEYGRLRPGLQPVILRIHQVLYDPGEMISHVYFPITAVVSLLVALEDGTAVETALVGDEGLVGLPLALGRQADVNRALVQVGGSALRMTASGLRAAVGQGGELRAAVDRYAHVLIAQTAQGAACNRLHSIHARCARWLLETHDRVTGDDFPLTQDFLASMLAVRRATVSVAAGLLQAAGFIRYQRGHIRIVNRAGLEAASCDCYRAIRDLAAATLGTRRRLAS